MKNKDIMSRKISVVKRAFTQPDPLPKKALFCDPSAGRPCVTLCGAGVEGCGLGCGEVRQAVIEGIARTGVEIAVGNMKVGCGGTCRRGPIMGFPQRMFFYVGVKSADVPRIIDETIMGGKLIFPFLSLDSERSYRSDLFYDKHSGLLAAIDEKVCMVDVARYFLDFEENLSCGKCVPCRIGLKRAHECVNRISAGEGTEEDLEQIKLLCQVMETTPNCEFAAASIKPLQSAVNYFEDEFRKHIGEKECSAGVCEQLVAYQRKLATPEIPGQTRILDLTPREVG
jgi:(2Fe-2S) ferredoxin